MDALINEGKTKGFNCMLRCLHYALLLITVNRATNASMMLCSEPSTVYHHISYITTLVMLFLGILGVCYIHFKYQFPRVEFFVCLAVEIFLVIATIWYSISSMAARERECIQIIILEKWGVFASLRLLLELLAVMVFKIFWIQRYTNGPGNLTWSYMFLTISWATVPYTKPLFVGIGVTYLIISIITLILNLASRRANRAFFTRYLKIWWIAAMVIMLVFEVLAAVKLYFSDFTEKYYETGAKRMLYIFLIGNLIDLMFWGWGLLTLRVESGDVVRNGLEDGKEERQL